MRKKELIVWVNDLKPYCIKPILFDFGFYKREIACCKCKGCKSRIRQIAKEDAYEKKKTKKISFISS